MNLNVPLFESASFPWFVAGGWAIDLALNRETRVHNDLDIGIFRKDQDSLHTLFHGWNMHKIVNRELHLWLLGEKLKLPVHEVHCIHPLKNRVEILLNEEENGRWVYRRDKRITRELDKSILRSHKGLPYLAPEIVLLYKSKRPRDEDHSDLTNILPILKEESRKWLADALKTRASRHEWLEMLE